MNENGLNLCIGINAKFELNFPRILGLKKASTLLYGNLHTIFTLSTQGLFLGGDRVNTQTQLRDNK